MDTPWKYRGKPVKNIDISTFAGFVYKIVNKIDGREYIGMKYTMMKRDRKMVESKWRQYKSSCKNLKNDIDELGIDNFEFIIMKYCTSRAHTRYQELKQQIKLGVIEPHNRGKYYNQCITTTRIRDVHLSADLSHRKRRK